MTINKKIHFIGINGSGSSGAAILAKKMGFDVTGCDSNMDTPYAAQVRDARIPVFAGHDASHVNDADIVASVTSLTKLPEAIAAGNKLISWQEFLGKYILPAKRTVAVAGTHGKTTTSSMMASVMIAAGFDPTALIGAIVPEWGSSNRFGSGDFAVIEADEYANNFAPYHPDYVILNNIEMEHPEYFTDFEHYKKTFRDFLAGANRQGTLVYNADDANVVELITAFPGKKIPFSVRGIKIIADGAGQDFDGFHINLLGSHNVANATAVITMARELGIPDDITRAALAKFRGAGHRLEKIFENDRITIFDDYAHHHTQAEKTINAVRDAYPDAHIIVVYEPHQISRYTQNTADTLAALARADESIITEFWRGRESHLPVPDAVADIEKSGYKNIRYIPDINKSADAAFTAANAHTGKSVILVMGAGQSWKIAKALKEKFEY